MCTRERRMGEKGAVAFLTVIVISLILTTITLGFIRLMTSEQRQATDDELTKRAYYAAESGIEDAKRAIQEYLTDPTAYPRSNLTENDCDPAVGYNRILSADLDIEYECQLINLDGLYYTAKLGERETAFLKLKVAPSATQPIASVRISWHDKAAVTDGGNGAVTGSPRPNNTFPPHASWGTNVSLLRAEFVAHNSPITRGGIENLAGFIVPRNSGNMNLGALNQNVNGASSCDYSAVNSGYACQITINNLGSWRQSDERYLRLTPVYAGTNVQVELLDAGGSPILMTEAQAVIDVTGRATDVYRRVESRIDILSEAEFISPAAMVADEICKKFYITNNDVDFNNECYPAATTDPSGNPTGGIPGAGGSVAGNAAIGNFGGGGVVNGPVRHWMRSWPNASVYNDPNTIRGCKWEFGHNGQNVGTPPGFQLPDNPVIDRSNSGPVSPCRNGDRMSHEFPIICTGAGGTFSSQDSRAYTIRLTMYYTNGATVTDQRTEWIPRHTSQHSPLSTLPCRREQMP